MGYKLLSSVVKPCTTYAEGCGMGCRVWGGESNVVAVFLQVVFIGLVVRVGIPLNCV